MGKFMKFMIVTMVIAVITPLFIKGPGGQPLASIQGVDLSALTKLTQNLIVEKPKAHNQQIQPANNAMITASGNSLDNSVVNKIMSNSPSAQGARNFYKWKDKNGTWQFTLTPPNDPNLDYTHITTDPNANVIQSLSKKDIATTLGWKLPEEETDKPEGNELDMPSLPFPSSVPADQIPKLIEQAQQARDLMENRNVKLENL